MENENTKSDEVPTWGVSLPVQNVQEMVRRNPSCLPEIYIRNHDVKPDVSPESSDVPVIDLSLLSDGNEEELVKLDHACTDWGFFQVVNHGVAEDIMQHMKDSASWFFNLPLEEKNKYAMPSNDIQGYGQAYVVSKEQKRDWSDLLFLFIYPHNLRKLEYWPQELKGAIETYSAEVRRVAERLISSLSLMMKMDKDALLDMHKEVMQALRVNYYPTCCAPNNVLGVSPHSDTSSITILMQDDNITGLQLRHDGGWVPVKPIPKALVVNIGDVMEIWSNGKYRSIEHRAVTNKDKARFSFASFITPHQDVEIEPLDHMVDLQNPVQFYKTVKYGDYLRESLKRKMDGKAHTEFAKNNID